VPDHDNSSILNPHSSALRSPDHTEEKMPTQNIMTSVVDPDVPVVVKEVNKRDDTVSEEDEPNA
jgi:hypothetical protein